VIGVGGTAGAIGGMLFSIYIGQVLEKLGSYALIFVVAGTVYLLALLVIHLLVPRMEEAKVGDA
jgi:ACS family hexuronate transporter-like MFS transporter